jgi:hypothetical protein
MKSKRFFHVLSFGLLILVTACQSTGQSLRAAMARSGDTVNGLTLARGAEAALPLWSFCAPSQENSMIRTFNCRAPVLPALAIGHVFSLAEEVSANLSGSDLVWELSIDNQVVDLESFGRIEYVMPSMAKSPSSVREVFKKAVAWNIVLTDLRPGEHTLAFRAQSEADSHLWLVNLVIEAEGGTDISAAPFPLHS